MAELPNHRAMGRGMENTRMSKRCYYDVLGVQRTVDDEELKSAFRKLALKWHPDRNPGDLSSEVRFKEINEAYEILKDPEKRAAYDRFGHAAFEQGGVKRASEGNFDSSFSDLFESMFGMGGGREARAERSADLRHSIQITLEDAFAGKAAELRLPTFLSCEACSGTGAKAGTGPKICRECGGEGRIRFAQGFFTVERTCAACHGLGRVVETACPTCLGVGAVKRERTLLVNIPPGIEDGSCIRLAGEGEAGALGGPAGDLYIYVSIASHAFFQRDGADLHCRVPVSMVTAALGGEFEVRTIQGGKTRVKLPEGTQSGSRFRLKGKGMPVLHSRQTGDMYVEVVAETPQKLTKRQRELLSEFEKLGRDSKLTDAKYRPAA
jgi:molecular chaperone DnaJ